MILRPVWLRGEGEREKKKVEMNKRAKETVKNTNKKED